VKNINTAATKKLKPAHYLSRLLLFGFRRSLSASWGITKIASMPKFGG
jgi:hypothetical protein